MELLVDKLSKEEFHELEMGLRKSVLSHQTIDKIKKAYGLDPKNMQTVRVACDESHAHSYECLEFNNLSAHVVFKLLSIIEDYQRRLDEISEEANYHKY